MQRAAAVLVAMVVATAACGGDDDDASAPDEVTLEMWVNWEGEDLEHLEAIVDRYEDANPDVDVELTGGVADTPKLLAAVAGGTAPDVVATYDLSSMGKLCSTGAFIDLGERIDEAGIEPGTFPEAVEEAASFEGTACALPYVGDAFGLYYNRDMFEAAGITAPPTNLSELATTAKQLTRYAPDGSIEVAGFVPLVNYYESYLARFAPLIGAEYFDDEGRSAIADDPGWNEFFTWQRQLIDDLGGHDALTRFTASAGDVYTPSNPFQQGKIAMVLDGEWRGRYLADEAPDIRYGTAPMPVLDGRPELLGASIIGPEVLGIPKGSDHADEAFELIEFLATDTDAVVDFANALRNIPSTTEGLASDDLEVAEGFQVFLDSWEHPASQIPPVIEEGTSFLDALSAFAERWQAGEVDDLRAGLEAVDDEIDAVIAQG